MPPTSGSTSPVTAVRPRSTTPRWRPGATRSRVKSLPGLAPDGKRIVTSDDVLASTSLPKSVIVVGAGAVGVEFASMYHDLGVKTAVLEYLPAVVPQEDREVSQALERSFTRRGIEVMTNARFDTEAVKA